MICRPATFFPKNVDPSALPAIYGDARIFAAGILDRSGDEPF